MAHKKTKKTTSAKVVSTAGTILQDPMAPKKPKSVAGSALSQKTGKKKRKKH